MSVKPFAEGVLTLLYIGKRAADSEEELDSLCGVSLSYGSRRCW